MKQVTPGTSGSSKSLMQTLSFGESRLNVVLTQAKSSAETPLDTAKGEHHSGKKHLHSFLQS